MNRKFSATQFFIVLLLSLPVISKGQHSSKSTEFYVAFMENLDLSMNGPPGFSLVVSATDSTNGSILIPATGYVQDFSVGALTATEIFLPASIYYPQGDEAYTNTGMKVISDKPISLYAFHHRLYFSEATLVLPINELGSNYIVAAHSDDGVQGGVSQLVIEGTADNTEVEITPSVLTYSVRPPGIPFTITLNEGQLFQLQAFGDLTGTRVVSVDPDKKIAVFSGMRWGEVNCGATSHVYDENLPVSSWGSEYICVPFSGQGGDPLRIIASMDQTSVYFDGVLQATLNTGEFYEETVTATTYVNASHPVMAVQFDKGFVCNTSQNGDPNMLVLTPLSFTQTKSIFKSVNTFDTPDPDHFVNIVCLTDGVPFMTLDGEAISSFFNTVAGNSSYSYAQLLLTEGEHILQGSGKGGFQALCYGFGFADAYTFNTGFGEPVFVGIDNPSSKVPSFDIFPNPMQDAATIILTNMLPAKNGALHLRIYSMQGQLLREEPVRESYFPITRSGLRPGVYFCQLYSGNQTIATRKLVVE